MKLTLRDLFWLQVFVAIAICWGMEHRKESKELKELDESVFLLVAPSPKEISKESLERTETLAELQLLSSEDLMKRVAKVFDENMSWSWNTDASSYLTELIRRKMHRELQSLYDNARGNNSELLTALRRAQGHPDPVKIDVEISEKDRLGNTVTIPQIVATLQNVDAFAETVGYRAGGDYRSGRLDRWRVRLTDLHGRVVEDSNFLAWMGGGFVTFEGMKPGEKLASRFWLDLRSYVKPPTSGLYTLQVIHGNSHIAYDSNLHGLIVWTSDPIQVRVENRGPQIYSITALRILGAGLIVGIILLLNRLRIRWRQKSSGNSDTVKSPFRRDLLCLSLIMALVLGWLADSYRLRTEILKHQPDSEADWTIRLEND